MPNDIMIIWQMIGRDISHISWWLRQIFVNRGTITAIIIGINTAMQNYKKAAPMELSGFYLLSAVGG